MAPLLRLAQLRARSGDGRRFLRLRRNAYADEMWFAAANERDRLIAHSSAALMRLAGDPVMSHETAALLHGLPTLGMRHRAVLHATRTRRHQGLAPDYPGLLVHHAGLPDGHRCTVDGVPATCVARTVIDLARRRSVRAGIVVADAALHAQLCTVEELRLVSADCAAWPGIAKARRVIALADSLSESPLESISRVAFQVNGLPTPRLQARLGDDRVDFLWDRWRVIGEADGLEKYADPLAIAREKEREERLKGLGFAIVRWMWREAYRRPDELSDRVRATLARAGWRP